MNELLLLLAPLYLEVNNLRIFEPFSFTFVRARFLFNTRKDQKRKKNSPVFFQATHTLENGIPLKGVLAGWIVSFHRHLLF
jgi:hypothetical protein